VKRYLILLTIAIIAFGACKEKKVEETPQTGDELIDQINIEINSNPDNINLYYKRAGVLYEKGEFEPAIRDLEYAISVDSLQPQYYHLLADSYMDYFKSREALNVMEEAARRFPERIPTLLKLSEMQLILNQNENSIFTVNEILRLSPQNEEGYFMLGMNFREMGDIDRAINSFQTAVEMNPELTDAWLILAELHEKAGSDNVIDYYNNAISVDPENPQTYHSKAYYLQNKGKIKEALELYREINLIDRQYVDAYLNAGILYMEIDSFDRAYEQFKIISGIEPQNYLAYYYMGALEMAAEDYEAAKINFQNALNINSHYQRAILALEEVNKKLEENEI